MIRVKEAGPMEFARFYSGQIPVGEIRAFAVWRDQIIVGFGGVVRQGDIWRAFMDVPMKYMRPVVLRYARMVLTGRVIAVCDPNIPNAGAFLRRIGFEPTGEYEDGLEVMEWQD